MPYSRTTRILAIRHGETAWNVDTRLQGQLDIPLNDRGRWQAARLGAAMGEERLAALYASDLQRARDTALAVSGRTGLPVQQDEGLRERRFGCFQGQTVEEIAARHPGDVQRWRQRDPDFRPDGAETLREFHQRCVDTASRLAQAHAGETIALVAHGGVLDCLYRAATGMALEAPRTWQLGNASINRLLWTDGVFTMVAWGDTTHLETEPTLDEAGDGGRDPG
ncbi:phosphoglycerate mutase [Sphaerotilus hippei]|uniref:Phosphoglycerate mutase n=1 Tax=Sphaerotilus hippei TaxID=744406 RepID=A0A318GYN2_9BURK|nr:histidine phosphatase family protein [Sphaerotilus hippei]PXW93842.1 phosphoglycerate mutase [Sphaerotilus hippei]